MQINERTWILLALAIAVVVAIGLYFAASSRESQVHAAESNARVHRAHVELMDLQAENDALRRETAQRRRR